MDEQPKMTADEFRDAQQSLGLSDVQMGRMLGGLSAQHVRRLKVRNPGSPSARDLQPDQVRLMQAYLAGYRPDDWPTGKLAD